MKSESIKAASLSEEWRQPEVIADIAVFLECCETPEMLFDLRQCNIPPEAFKLASRQLPCEKQAQY